MPSRTLELDPCRSLFVSYHYDETRGCRKAPAALQTISLVELYLIHGGSTSVLVTPQRIQVLMYEINPCVVVREILPRVPPPLCRLFKYLTSEQHRNESTFKLGQLGVPV